MIYKVIFSTQFKKDYKKAQKRHKDMDILKSVVKTLAQGEKLPEKYRDHILAGDYKGKHECHLEPD